MDHSEDLPTPELSSKGFHNDDWVQNRLAGLHPPMDWQPNAEAGMALLKRGQRMARARQQAAICVLAAVVLTGTLVSFPMTRVVAKRCVDACVAGTNAAGHLLGMTPAARSSHERKMAPPLRLKDRYGNAVELSDFSGKVVVLNFWATWCGPCKIEIPWFAEFRQRFGDLGVTVLGISMDEDGWKSVGPYLDAEKVDYPVMIGTGELAKAYGGFDVLPMTFLINKSGRIAFVHKGLVSKATYESEIKMLASE